MLQRSILVFLLVSTFAVRAENAAAPVGAPVLERPTLLCLGAYWVIRGDDNGNAVVTVDYRIQGESDWRRGPNLFRVEKGRHVPDKYPARVDVPKDGRLFAGSVVMLKPDTAYELRLTLTDPDGGAATHTLAARTRGEPVEPPGMNVVHVAPPGEPAGDGSAGRPYRGIHAARGKAKPGTVFLMHAGVYPGELAVDKSGEPGRPIVFRAAGDGEVVLDGASTPEKRTPRVITAANVHDVWFEGLTIRNATYGISANDSARVVVRRCKITNVDYGFSATRDTDGRRCEDHLIVDNVIEGPSAWPRGKGIENARGVQVTGAGHVVAYNRIRAFADAMDTYPSPRVEAIDFHHNDCTEMTDDGCELDYSQRNTRCFANRFTNVFQGISVQPVFGGPTYVFRNALYNVPMEPFKIHNGPSGALFYHNTVVKKGPPMLVLTPEPASNLVMRNNLFVGTNYVAGVKMSACAWECLPRMTYCDFDYSAFVGEGYPVYLKWNGTRYPTFEAMRAKSPIERNALRLKAAGLFASGAVPPSDEKVEQKVTDLRPAAGAGVVDAGEVLPGFNDGFGGKGPDIGAYEAGEEMPKYGPRER
ncbi:MAG TPA: right-handed parallel beta-helix repeat-containing protein [Tepidisphaeraceae bacterium]|nr:right-handed parallel beta-helix repeat-containing protein [Tepidisphaeraceae bacterium]